MKRAIIMAVLVCWAGMLLGCGGSSSSTPDVEAGPLKINLLAASPNSGSSPLRVTFTANISGGVAPYFYAWDFTNDGAYDQYLNASFNRTVNTQNDYFIRASDAGGQSLYEAVLRVMDSEGTEVLSEPVEVVVMAGTGFTAVPEQTFWFTDEQAGDGSYVARSGDPVYFRIQPTGGTAPYSYQWDFDFDGKVDSTIATPQYTYTNPDLGLKLFVARVRVIDDKGEEFIYDFPVIPVYGGEGTPPEVERFDIILNSSPEATDATPYPLITLKYDPSGTSESFPTQPELDLAVIVDPDPDNGGTPPFEYYWDFENDGAFDSQVLSPTIPYYDSARKIVVNPYLHMEDSKTYTLRCMVIDSEGRIAETFRTVKSMNVVGRLGVLEIADTNYGVGTTGIPYAEVNGPNATTDANFSFTLAGSSGVYEYQIDTNGDGSPDLPLIDHDNDELTDPIPGWDAVSGNTLNQTLTFMGPGYFPIKFSFRAMQSGNPIDFDSKVTPISLVQRNVIEYDGTLMDRADHAVASTWSAPAGGPNGTYLESRQLVITGGAQGLTPLRDVERLTQTFAIPNAEGEFESIVGAEATKHFPMSFERRGHVMWNDGTYLYVHGGNNLINGILGFSEAMPTADPSATSPWFVLNELYASDFFPLTDMAGCVGTVATSGPEYLPFSRDAGGAYTGLFFIGGIHPPSGSDADDVSGRFIMYHSLNWPDGNGLPPFNPDSYLNSNIPNPVERYDGELVYYSTNETFFFIGGRVASGQSVATVEAFDMSSKVWYQVPSMLQPRSGFCAEIIGGKIYVYGGAYYPSDESDLTLVETAEVYDPETGVWINTVPLLNPSNNGASTSMPGPGSVSSSGVFENTMWYFGGDGVAGENHNLEEMVYFYTVEPPAV